MDSYRKVRASEFGERDVESVVLIFKEQLGSVCKS